MALKFAKLPEGHDDFNVNDELEKAILALNKKPWDRSIGVFHPSSLGKCKRNLYYDRIGEIPIRRNSVEQHIIFLLGHGTHDWVQKLFASIAKDFKAEVPARNAELGLGGHCDGVFSDRGWVLEIKSMGKATFSALLRPLVEHVEQAHAYMAALGIPRAQLLYVNRDDGTRRVFRVFFDENIWNKILGDLAEVEQAIQNGQLPERKVDFFCRWCKFEHVCKPSEEQNAGANRSTNLTAQRTAPGGRGGSNNSGASVPDRRKEHPQSAAGVSGADNQADGNRVKRQLRFIPRILRVSNNSADKV